LNPRKVVEIRALIVQGVSFAKIAAMYRVGYHSVYLIAQGLTWRRWGMPPGFRQWQRDHIGCVHRPNTRTIEPLERAARAS
jgi:hypothetical protein